MKRCFLANLYLWIFLFSFVRGHAEDRQLPTIVVTCATGELGGAIAKKLASDNNLILTGRDVVKLKSLQEELTSQYRGIYEIIELDYANSASLAGFETALASLSATISGFVLITPRPPFGSSLLQADKEWIHLFQTTFTGPLEALKQVLPHLTSPGKIAIIGGTTSVQLLPEHGPVCVVRRMWSTYVKALSHQLGPQGICVNMLSPGVVLTNFHAERIAKKADQNQIEYEEQMKQEVANIPLRRHATPLEIAQSVKFLLSSDSDFINGVNVVIDGGLTLSY